MTETLLSPGVLARENDQSFITQGPIEAGAAIVGPAVKGPVGIPTLVTTYSDYVNKFGNTFISGGVLYSYLTSIAANNYFNNGGTTLLVTRVTPEAFTSATSQQLGALGILSSGSYSASFFGIDQAPFVLETLSQGDIMNNTGSILANGLLATGSGDNIKYQIVSPNTSSGTFSLLIRQGNDNDITPTVLETWSNLSLDPFAPNYIESVIGNQAFSVQTDSSTGTTYVQTSGQYINASRYVRVKQVNYTTPNYLDINGNIGTGSYVSASVAATAPYYAFLPAAYTGSFGGATGSLWISGSFPNMYQNITTAGNIQGLDASRYTQSLNLLSNADDYKFDIISIPGVTQAQGGTSATAINQMITLCQNRGDAIAVVDTNNYNASVGSVVNNANGFDTSYAATYWPWLQTVDPGTGQRVWVPASTMIPGVYAFTDNVAEPWFAPAGINRGGLGLVTQAERRLSQADRDSLYQNRVNPIATFPGSGVVVYGQKTLQKKASALDRVNVRRLLIALKSYISQVATTLVFEQNTATTRASFLSQVNPYLESVQQRQGLFSFQVVMDDSNNTPDVIDRNQLVGQIYLQPTRTAEFILLDFNILPTGATFG